MFSSRSRTQLREAWGAPFSLTLPIPDEELAEPIHLMLGVREMACGATEGVGVFVCVERVTCASCREAQGMPLIDQTS